MELEGFVDASAIMRAGVYALVSRGQVIYVGKSKAMLARTYTHRQNWIAKRKGRAVPDWLTPVKGILFDELHVRPCRLEDLDTLEAQMIDKYKPKMNLLLKTQDKITAPINLVINGVALGLNSPAPGPHFERRV